MLVGHNLCNTIIRGFPVNILDVKGQIVRNELNLCSDKLINSCN